MEVDWPIWPARVPNDPDFPFIQEPYLKAMKAPAAWHINTGIPRGQRPSNITACVIDSGIDIEHPDLKANLASPPGINVVDMDSSEWADMRNNASWYLGVSRPLLECCHSTSWKPA